MSSSLDGERDLAEQLLRLAHDDEAAARALLDVGVAHDLGALGELSANAGAALPPELSEIDQLTPFGVSLRYGALDDLAPVARLIRLLLNPVDRRKRRDALRVMQGGSRS